MKEKIIIVLIIASALGLTETCTHASKILTVIDDLKSANSDIAEKTCKALKIECGALGPSRVQFFQPFTKEEHFFVVAVSFESPMNGYIILTDLEGNALDTRRVGYIKSLAFRSLKTLSDDVLVADVIEGTGTGTRSDRYYVYSIINRKLNELWTGESYEKTFLGEDWNHEIKGTINFEDVDNDRVEEIIYCIEHITYSTESKTQKSVPVKTEKETKIYKLTNGKYMFLKNR